MLPWFSSYQWLTIAPPHTLMACPVMYEAAGETRSATAWTTSSAVP
jgi:hypothetical protein